MTITDYKISKAGLELIKLNEGFKGEAYYDYSGYAIAFGNHNHPDGRLVKKGDTLKDTKSNRVLYENYIIKALENRVYPWIYKNITVSITQNQFDGISSFIYSLRKLKNDITNAVNSGNSAEVRRVMFIYVNAFNDKTGKRDFNIAGLINRRTREYAMYSTGSYPINGAGATNKNKRSPASGKNPNSNTALQNQKQIVISTSELVTIAKSQIGVAETSPYSGYGVQVNQYLASVGLPPRNDWMYAFVYWCVDKLCKQKGIENPLPKFNKDFLSIKGITTFSAKQIQLAKPGTLYFTTNNTDLNAGIVENVTGSTINAIGVYGNEVNKNEIRTVRQGQTNINQVITFVNIESVLKSISANQFTGYSQDFLNYFNPSGNTTNTPSQSTQTETIESAKPTQPDYLIKINNSPSENTIQNFIDKEGIVNWIPQDLLGFRDNATNVYNSYTEDQKKMYAGATENLIGMGAAISIPFDKLLSQSIYTINQTLAKNTNYESFLTEKIKSLLNNPDYKKVNNGQTAGFSRIGDLYKKYDQIQVWIWSRAIDNSGINMIDITPFIENANTNVNSNGGNFSLELSHIVYNSGADFTKLKASDLFMNFYESSQAYGLNNFVHKEGSHKVSVFNATVNFNDDNNQLGDAGYKYFQRNESFFHRILQNNDVVFIRLEKLQLDNNISNDSSAMPNDITISADRLPGQCFDMIGLIDEVTKTTTISDPAVLLNGRDLSKLLLDDGTYFFDTEFAVSDREQIIKNSTKTKAGNRFILDSNIKSSSGYDSHIIHAIQGQLGDNSFNFDRTQSIFEWMTFLFSQLTNIDICPDNLFRNYKNKGDDVTQIVVRQQQGDNSSYITENANGIWGIANLIIDPSIGNRKIADTSFTTATGSLLNLVRKICQPPFVEFFMDTYGDRFYYIARKPPFSEFAYKSNFTINIFEQDVIRDDIQFTNEFYTWYKLTPAGSLLYVSEGDSLITLPAVMFPEYMEVWGSKILDITTQYVDFDQTISDQTATNLDNMILQAREDLDWLIESHAYLPFTTEGTITIKADRRIKRGMNIRYMPTGEIFYVDGVSHTKSFKEIPGQTTTLHISRGMVEKHIDKYFQLINLLRRSNQNLNTTVAPTKNMNGSVNKLSSWNDDTWTVNKDIFNFLLARKQFLN